jgi:hypothetical protein
MAPSHAAKAAPASAGGGPQNNEMLGGSREFSNANTREIQPKYQAQDYVRAPLLRDYIVENLLKFEWLSVSAREAIWRENDDLAGAHIEQLRLTGREIVRSFQELKAFGGDS